MSQGVVSDYLKNLISKQVDDRGLVVWYDPEQDSLAGRGQDISTGVLTLIFGSANPQEVALTFLHGDQHAARGDVGVAHGERRPAQAHKGVVIAPMCLRADAERGEGRCFTDPRRTDDDVRGHVP